MRLDRYFKEQRRLRSDSRKKKLFIVGIVIGVHLFAAAGWTAWAAYRERNAPPRQIITYFDIAPLPVAPVAPAGAEEVAEALKLEKLAPTPEPTPEAEQPSSPTPAAPQQP